MLATFQRLNNHMWVVAIIEQCTTTVPSLWKVLLDSIVLKHLQNSKITLES